MTTYPKILHTTSPIYPKVTGVTSGSFPAKDIVFSGMFPKKQVVTEEGYPKVLLSVADYNAISYVFTNAEAAALVARMSIIPDATRQALIDTLVGSLKTAGAWTIMDILYVPMAADAQAAGLNWKGDSQFDLQQNGSIAFTTDRGYLSDGTTGYYNTTYNPALDATSYALDSASMGVWIQTAATGTNSSEIGTIGARIYSKQTTNGNIITRANDGTLTPTVLGAATTRLISWSRNNALNYDVYYRGANVATPAVTSTAVTSGNLEIGRSGGVYSNTVIGAGFAGGALSAIQMQAVSDALDVYATAIGAM